MFVVAGAHFCVQMQSRKYPVNKYALLDTAYAQVRTQTWYSKERHMKIMYRVTWRGEIGPERKGNAR